jgi:hypothetical protein
MLKLEDIKRRIKSTSERLDELTRYADIKFGSKAYHAARREQERYSHYINTGESDGPIEEAEEG